MNTRSDTYLAYQLIFLVASHYEVSLKELICGKSDNARLARGSAVYAIRKHANLPLSSIAPLLGFDTTEKVLYTLRMYEAKMKEKNHLPRVQHLIEDFVSAAIDLQMPSAKDADTDDLPASTAMEPEKKQVMDRTAFYKWSKILAYLEDHFGAVTIASWFEDARVIEFTEKSLKIDTGSDFRCEIIKRRCLNHIQDALKELFGSEATVEVVANGI